MVPFVVPLLIVVFFKGQLWYISRVLAYFPNPARQHSSSDYLGVSSLNFSIIYNRCIIIRQTYNASTNDVDQRQISEALT